MSKVRRNLDSSALNPDQRLVLHFAKVAISGNNPLQDIPQDCSPERGVPENNPEITINYNFYFLVTAGNIKLQLLVFEVV